MAKYYRQLSTARLAGLLGLTPDETEEQLSVMVSDQGLYCKIDRPAGVAKGRAGREAWTMLPRRASSGLPTLPRRASRACIQVRFAKPKPPDEVLEDWASDVSKMLSLVEMTCHLINKETMLHPEAGLVKA